MDLDSWVRQRAMLMAASDAVSLNFAAELAPSFPPQQLHASTISEEQSRHHGSPGLSRLSAQVCTVLLFLFVAAWPFAPILVHWKPWAPQPTVAFLALLLTLAWVLVARSHSIFAALLSSWLTLALTGLTAWEYTTEQVRLHQ